MLLYDMQKYIKTKLVTEDIFNKKIDQIKKKLNELL